MFIFQFEIKTFNNSSGRQELWPPRIGNSTRNWGSCWLCVGLAWPHADTMLICDPLERTGPACAIPALAWLVHLSSRSRSDTGMGQFARPPPHFGNFSRFLPRTAGQGNRVASCRGCPRSGWPLLTHRATKTRSASAPNLARKSV